MLRRVLVRPPVGLGGRLWVDAAAFRIEDHVGLGPAAGPTGLEDFWSWCAARSLAPAPRS